MKSQLLQEQDGLKTFAVVFDKDEDLKERLLQFATENQIRTAQVIGIGAFSGVTLGFFDREKKRYQEIPINEQVEVLSFTGNIVQKDDKPVLHAHVVVGKADGAAHGGHFLRGQVWPTLEMMVFQTHVSIHRVYDEETGLPLIDLAS